jgi:hypothetical protein
MSCLYSSPGKTLDLPLAAIDQTRVDNAPHPDAAPIRVDGVDRRAQQRRVPHPPALITGEPFI